MRKIPFLVFGLLPSMWLLTGCYKPPFESYYVSPFHGVNDGYHALPQLRDSVHTTVYVDGHLLGGSTNSSMIDGFTGGQARIHAAHRAGRFQFYCGLDLTLGSFRMSKWDSTYVGWTGTVPPIPQRVASPLNKYAGERFFGGAGFSGGVTYSKPVSGGEWRVIGVETSLHREFGDYLSLRRQLPDSVATVIIRSPFLGTAGLTTEMIGYTDHGEFGFRFAYGWALGDAYHNARANGRPKTYHYFTLSAHYTYERFTPYFLLGGGTDVSSFNLGLQYRLGRPRMAPRMREGHATAR